MPTIVVRTPAKLNLTFDILGLRPDGFHEIETLFQSISLEDELEVTVEESCSAGFQIVCDNQAACRQLPLDESNLIGKASRVFLKYLQDWRRTGEYKIHVHLKKRIPIGAGLAGGSANAAGMLLALNRACGELFALSDLMDLAANIGSDVPFCLKGGTCLGRGRGEILMEIDSRLPLFFCLVKPGNLSVSTPWAYKTFDSYSKQLRKPCLDKTIAGLSSAQLDLALSGFANVFEPLVFENYPELARLKEELLRLGARACQMSGSGPTLFAVIEDPETGSRMKQQLLSVQSTCRVPGLGLASNGAAHLSKSEEAGNMAPVHLEIHLVQSCSYGARVVS